MQRKLKKIRKNPKETNRKWLWICLPLAIFLLCSSLGLSWGIRVFLLQIFHLDENSIEHPFIFAEIVLAAIAAIPVLFQLNADTKAKEEQVKVDKAQFISEFNKTFMESAGMDRIESYLESSITGESLSSLMDLSINRSDLMNYLVYLEGFSACVLQEVVEFEDIDDLFFYRFFLAMNHPEVQTVELCPYATYYRSCFKLYDKWLEYRMSTPEYNENGVQNWDIPLYDTSLYFWKDYEKYCKSGIIEDGKKILQQKQINERKFCKKYSTQFKREKIIQYALTSNCELKNKIEYVKKKGMKTEWRNSEEHVEKYKKIINVYEDGGRFFQLRNGQIIPDHNLQKIAQLLYDANRNIYNDLFGCQEIAEDIIPKLLKSGKDAMFNLDNIFVCMLNGDIVCLLFFLKGPLQWGPRELKNQLSYRIPKTFDNIVNQYNESFGDVDKNTISIFSICASDNDQRESIETAMLTAFRNAHAREKMVAYVSESDSAMKKMFKSVDIAIMSSTG